MLAGILALMLAGCAGYKLGPTTGIPAGEKSVQVNPFVNRTDEPRLNDAVTHALRKAIQTDGSYRLDTKNDGDIVVTGTITRLDRDGLSFNPADVRTPRDYHVFMTAHITAIERTTGRTNLNRTVRGRTTIRIGADLASTERQAIPLLAEDLARNVTSLLAEGTW